MNTAISGETREALKAHLIVEEKVVKHVYPDSKGYWTIACGRLVDQRKGGGLSYTECMYLLDNDIDVRVSDVIERFPRLLELDPVRQNILLAMAFQMGVDGLAGFHGTLAAVWRKDWDAAAAGMLNSKWARIDSPARAARLAEAMRTGRMP